ncbi:MAG: hypothetical protein AAFN78_21070, partial [Pseudomonadota bacterium]
MLRPLIGLAGAAAVAALAAALWLALKAPALQVDAAPQASPVASPAAPTDVDGSFSLELSRELRQPPAPGSRPRLVDAPATPAVSSWREPARIALALFAGGALIAFGTGLFLRPARPVAAPDPDAQQYAGAVRTGELQEQVGTLEAELASARAALDDAQAQAAGTREALTSGEAAHAEERSALEEKLEALTEQSATESRQREQAAAALETELEQLRNDADAARQELAQVRDTTGAEIDRLRTALSAPVVSRTCASSWRAAS